LALATSAWVRSLLPATVSRNASITTENQIITKGVIQ
jgi:hypothetical protein